MSEDYGNLRHSLETLREELSQVACAREGVSPPDFSLVGDADVAKDLIITPCESNGTHGTGILLSRIFNPQTSIGIRSSDGFFEYGAGPFPTYLVNGGGKSRQEIFLLTEKAVARKNIRRIICVPIREEDFLISIAAKCLLDVPLVVWILDEYPHASERIRREIFGLANICFVISAEMRDAYEARFHKKFYVLPPTVESSLLTRPFQRRISENLAKKNCVMIGNVWARAWLENLLRILKKSGWNVHWYGLASRCTWLKTSREELGTYGIIEKGFVSQEDLLECLATYPFALAPTGTGDAADPYAKLTLFSFSSRIPFLLAAAHLPILALGNEKSCIANFVRNYNVGISAKYEEEEFRLALNKLSDSNFIEQCSQNAALTAQAFSDAGLEEWIRKSCDNHRAIDARFEKLFQRQPGSSIPYQEDPVPPNFKSSQAVYAGLNRLAQRPYQPDFILDVGAAYGGWSVIAQRLFPRARFILMDPLAERYPQGYHLQYPQFEWVTTAAAHENGQATFYIPDGFLGGSLFPSNGECLDQICEVATLTLDTILTEKVIEGRGLLRVNAHSAEHLVIQGALTFLGRVDVVILTLCLRPEGGRTFVEMIHRMESLGFQYVDDVGVWRCPADGTLQQKDVLFIAKHLKNI